MKACREVLTAQELGFYLLQRFKTLVSQLIGSFIGLLPSRTPSIECALAPEMRHPRRCWLGPRSFVLCHCCLTRWRWYGSLFKRWLKLFRCLLWIAVASVNVQYCSIGWEMWVPNTSVRRQKFSPYLICTLLIMVAAIIAVIMANGWKTTHELGGAMFLLYFAYLT